MSKLGIENMSALYSEKESCRSISNTYTEATRTYESSLTPGFSYLAIPYPAMVMPANHNGRIEEWTYGRHWQLPY